MTVSDNRGGTATAAALVSVAPPPNRAPTANAGGPYSGTAGQAIAFAGTGSDPDDDPLSFAWTFSDGATAAGAAVSHAFAAAGSYTATLTVGDGRGGTAAATATVTVAAVPPVNHPPTAAAGGPYSGTAGQPVTFTGTGADADNDPLTFSWTFSDGGSAAGASVTHTFASAGSYTATLTVSDGRGGTGTGSATVTVGEAPPVNRPPTANAGGPYSGTAGQPITFTGTGSDPDNDPLTFSWTFSDGGSAAGASVTHTFASAGSYTATLTVSDGRGGTTAGSATVTVGEAPPVNRPPTANAGGPYSGTAGYTVTFQGAGSDADGDPLTFSWAFSDGGMASGATASHTFAAAGSYTATLTVGDGRGGAAASTATVTVTTPQPGNQPPTVSTGGPYSGTAGQPVVLTATASDPDNDPLTFSWSFGDGSGGAGATATHTFAVGGSYTATVTVSDGRGGTATASATVTVSAVTPGNEAPTARLSAPASGVVSQSLAFDASASSDPDGDPLTYSWSFGDGATAAGPTAGHAYAASGSFTVAVTVNDGHGHTHAATAAVRVDPPVNRPPTAHAGGPYSGEVSIPVLFTGARSLDPDGDALSYSWDFGDGASGTGQGPTHAYTAAGSYSVTLTVTDGHEHSASATASITVSVQPDRAPPVVSLSAPREALPGTEVSIVADATDNLGVVSVVIQVNGEPASFNAPPYQRAYTLPQMSSPGAVIPVTVVATDAAGNAGTASASITVGSQPDTESPTVTMFAPSEAAAGGTVTITANAQDNAGLALVALFVDGAQVSGRTAPPYQFSWTVPAGAPAGTTYQLLVRATDYAGHSAEVTATLSVTAAPQDTQPPSVVLVLPPAVAAGSQLLMAASASDNVGVASVSFFVDGARIATVVSPPYDTSYLVPGELPAGAVLQVEARALDGAGLSATDARTATVTTTVAPGEGLLLGRVYDDVTGLAVEGALVTVTGRSALGQAYTRVAASDARGGYVIMAPAGQAVLRVTKAGMTAVDRAVTFVADARARRVFDARLTPLSAPAAVSATLGGTVLHEGLLLTVPAAAVAADVPVALTPVGGQGLQGLLPAGWSPVAAVDVTPHGVAFGQAVSLAAPNTARLAPATPLVLARWDESLLSWRAVTTGQIRADGAAIEGSIDGTGQYAWLLADGLPAAPPQPASGERLAGVTGPAVPEAAAAAVMPDPRVIFYSPGARSLVSGSITTATVLASGTPVTARLTESYRFTSGAEVHPEPRAQDLVLYQVPGAPERVSAVFPATPSLTFDAITLQRGVIGVELRTPDPDVPVQVVAGAGGSIDGPSAQRLDVPAGAVAVATPIDLSSVVLADTGVALPAGLEWLGGVSVSFTGELARAAILSIVKPPSAASAERIVLVRLAEIQGETRLVFVARARFDGDRLLADVTLPGSADLLEGVRVPGRYLFLQAAVPLAFLNGTVFGVNGVPFGGAPVTSDRLALTSFSSAAGRYAAALPGGPALLLATDLARNDSGSAVGTAVAGVSTPLDITLRAQPPSVVLLAPPEGATNVALSEPIVVRFSEPVNPATVTVASILLTGPSGAVPGTLSLSAGNTVAVLRPSELLAPNAAYTVTVAGTIADVSGYTMGAPVVRHFTSLDTTAPVAPPAGSLSATIPSGGMTTVRGTQGSAGLHDSVRIVNVTRGTSTPALVNPDGSFQASLAVGLTDALKVEITDTAGNTTVADLPAFREVHADGRVSQVVGAKGGHIDGPAGIGIDVFDGTFPEGAVVTVGSARQEEFPAFTPEQAAVFAFAGGVSLDFGGVTPQHYLNVSVPAGAADGPEDQWVVSRLGSVGGQPALEVVDTAKLIGGRVATSSPPCPGVLSNGQYLFAKSGSPLGLVYGASPSAGGTTQINAALGDSSNLPYSWFGSTSTSFCLPLVTGRFTVSANAVRIELPGGTFAATDQQLRVTDTTAGFGTSETFAIPNLSYEYPLLAGEQYEAWTSPPLPVRLPLTMGPEENGIVGARVRIGDVPAGTSSVTFKAVSGSLSPVIKLLTDLPVVVTVAGSPSHASAYQVEVSDWSSWRPVAPAGFTSSAGDGDLVLRALTRTFDVSKTTRIQLSNDTKGEIRDVPLNVVKDGGFTYAFDSGGWALADRYSVVLTGQIPADVVTVLIPQSIIRVVSAGVPRTIVIPAPPKGTAAYIPSVDPTDNDSNHHPRLTVPPTDYLGVDCSQPLVFTFDAPINNAATAFVLKTSGGAVVKGTVWVSEDGKTLSFYPEEPLHPGETYVANLGDLQDRGGHKLASQQLVTVTTPAPSAGTSVPIQKIVDMVPLPASAGLGGTGFVAVSGTADGDKLLVIDASHDPANMVVGRAGGGFYKKRVTVSAGVDQMAVRTDANALASPPCPQWGPTFTGDIAVATSEHTWAGVFVTFYDLRNLASPCVMGMKTLAIDPQNMIQRTEVGTVHKAGIAGGVAVLGGGGTYTAYVAVGQVGLMSVDIGKSSPEVYPLERQLEPYLPGDYRDVVAAGTRLLALNMGDLQLEVIDAGLTVLTRLPLPIKNGPTFPRLVYSEGVPWDRNGDGVRRDGEQANLAIVSSANSIVIADVTDLDVPKVVSAATVPGLMSGNVLSMDFDPARRWVWVKTAEMIAVLDFSGTPSVGAVDANGDGMDDRVVWASPLIGEGVVRVGLGGNVFLGRDASLEQYVFGPPAVVGRATYRRFYPAAAGGLDYATDIWKPIRGAFVELWNRATNAPIAHTVTSESGTYSFGGVASGTDVEVRVYAKTDDSATPLLSVVNNLSTPVKTLMAGVETPAGQVYRMHSKAGPTPVPPGGRLQLDVKADTDWRLPPVPGTPGKYEGRDGAPFAIFDTIYGAESQTRQATPSIVLPPLRIDWSPLNSRTDGVYGKGEIDGTAYVRGTPAVIKLVGADNVDTDEYDEPVLLHEWGHYFIGTQSRSSTTGGSHSAGNRLHPGFAYAEGVASAIAMIFSATPDYYDTGGVNQQEGTPESAEADNPAGGADGFWNEEAMIRVILDLYDGKGPDASLGGASDSVQFGWGPLLRALSGPLKTTPDAVTIYSLVYALRSDALFAPQQAALTTLLGHYNLGLPDRPFFGAFYTPLTTAGILAGQSVTATTHPEGEWKDGPLAFRSTYFVNSGTRNDKFYSGWGTAQTYGARELLAVTIETAATYTIAVEKLPAAPTTPIYFELSKDGASVIDKITSGMFDKLEATQALQPGTYLLDVRGGPLTVPPPAEVQFRVVITRK